MATKIPPPKPLNPEIVTIPEIADLVDVKLNAIALWRSRSKNTDLPFPEPDDYAGSAPVWRLARVTQWLEATGRPYDLDRWRSKKADGGYRRSTTLKAVNDARAAAKKTAGK